MLKQRYVLDPLYGRVGFPDYVWRVAAAPEVQRLREVRLCNINSLSLTGAANVSRFEHSLGTAHLALRCADAHFLQLSQDEVRLLVLAALLHDVGSAAFGHSVQYVLDEQGYRHESIYDILVSNTSTDFRYQWATMEPVFFGLSKQLPHLLSDGELRVIAEMVGGRGLLGPLISGDIDLDNLDNVFRMAHHMGIPADATVPVRLAPMLSADTDGLVAEDDAVPLVHEWHKVRRMVYEYLLINADEFSAKCMLEEALFCALKESSVSFSWHDVDYEILSKLRSSPGARDIVARLMVGELYGCLALLSVDPPPLTSAASTRASLEQRLSARLRGLPNRRLSRIQPAVHLIRDVNKTERQLRIRTQSGRRITIGDSTNRLLIGVFVKNLGWSVNDMRVEVYDDPDLAILLRQVMQDEFGCVQSEFIPPYSEGD